MRDHSPSPQLVESGIASAGAVMARGRAALNNCGPEGGTS